MGNAVTRIAEEHDDVTISAGLDANTKSRSGFPVYDNFTDIGEEVDCIVDFSHPSLTDGILEYAKSRGIPAVICTTGLSREQVSKLEFYSREIPIFFSANMSIGVNLITDLVCRAAKVLDRSFDIEIVEKHHNQKVDAPSGTALAIADAISETVSFNPQYTYDRHSVRKKRGRDEIGIHSVRGGNIVGEHSIIFAGCDEVIEIKHTAASKEVFAAGAIRAAAFLSGKAAGLYNMTDLIKSI